MSEKDDYILAAEKSRKRKKVRNYAIFSLVLAGIVFIIIFSIANVGAGKYDGFAQCTNEAGFIMYGAFWCPHCQDQKSRFGSSFDYVNYVECDARGKDAQPELCEEKDIKSYPTWIAEDGTVYNAVLSLERIASITDCELKEDTS